MQQKGKNYLKRAVEVQAIFDKWSKLGLSNREIWRRHIYPRYCLSERSFYNIISRQVEADQLPASALLHPELGLPLWQQKTTTKE